MLDHNEPTLKCQVSLEIVIDNKHGQLKNDPSEPCVEEAHQVAVLLEKRQHAPLAGPARPTAFKCTNCQFSAFYPTGENVLDVNICPRCDRYFTEAITTGSALTVDNPMIHKIGRKYTVSKWLNPRHVTLHGDLAVQDHFFVVEPAPNATSDVLGRPAVKITTPRRELSREAESSNHELRELINDLAHAVPRVTIDPSCTTSVHVSFDRSLDTTYAALRKMKELIILTAILERDFLMPISGPHDGQKRVAAFINTRFMTTPGLPTADGWGSWGSLRDCMRTGNPALTFWDDQMFLGFSPTQRPAFWKHYQPGMHPMGHDLNVFINLVWNAKDPKELWNGMQSSTGRVPGIQFHLTAAESVGLNSADQMSLEFRYQSGTLDCGHINLWIELIGQMVKLVNREPVVRQQYMAHLYSVLPDGPMPAITDFEERPLREILKTFDMSNRADEWIRRLNEIYDGQPRPLGRDGFLKPGAGDC